MNFMLQAVRFFMSSILSVIGLKVKNSPQFHFRFDNCQNVYIESLNIKAPALSPNTDGIHIENTNNVKLYNSVISNGNYTTEASNLLSIMQSLKSLPCSLVIDTSCR